MKDSDVFAHLRNHHPRFKQLRAKYALGPPHRCECVHHEGGCLIREVVHRHVVRVKRKSNVARGGPSKA